MGLLALGTPLAWPDTKPLAEHIRTHGITQFLNTWNRWKDHTGKGLLWGDEVSGRTVSLCPIDGWIVLAINGMEVNEVCKGMDWASECRGNPR